MHMHMHVAHGWSWAVGGGGGSSQRQWAAAPWAQRRPWLVEGGVGVVAATTLGPEEETSGRQLLVPTPRVTAGGT